MKRLSLIFLTGLIVVSGSTGFTQPTPESATSGADMAELAKKLNNPTASRISVPLQGNVDFGGGLNDDGGWQSEEWTNPINAFVKQLVKIGEMPVSLHCDVHTYLDKPIGGLDWGLRFGATLVFPK